MNWKEIIRSSITDYQTLKEHGLIENIENKPELALKLNPYVESLINKEDPNDPIRLQFVPSSKENHLVPAETLDGLGEDDNTVANVLVHKYPNRCILHVSNLCGSLCRFCTRKRNVENLPLSQDNYEQAYDYLRANPVIEDVLLTGGDALLVSDETLGNHLEQLSKVNSVKTVRLGTRVLSVVPHRIDDNLIKTLRQFPLVKYINCHFNSHREITNLTVDAANRLRDAGFILGSQTVLLKGVNDTPELMRTLCKQLFYLGIRPYYIYHCDLVSGLSHFRTTLEVGVNIRKKLQGYISGLAVPRYIMDCPQGIGKVPVNSDYIAKIGFHQNYPVWQVRNYKGDVFLYREEEGV